MDEDAGLGDSRICLLRGINVTGHNIIRMADLRTLFDDMGYEDVKTYIQSGNILFTDPAPAADAADRIATAIKERFGLTVPVLALTAAELSAALAALPFPDASDRDPRRVFLTFLDREPAPTAIAALEAVPGGEGEVCRATGRVVYLDLPEGYARTVYSNDFIEKRLGVRATTRNLRTSRKLAEMAGYDGSVR